MPPGTTHEEHLAQLRRHAELKKRAFRYEDTPAGARVRITSSEATTTEAVHEFLRYQIREHATGDPLTVDK